MPDCPAPNRRTVPLLELSRDHAPLRDEMLAAMSNVLDSGRFLHGAEVSELEQRVSRLCGVRHAVACASGSDALLLALMAYEIGPGDEVIVPSFTFFATASAVWRLGAKIVFVDIDPATFNIESRAIASAVTPRTRAVIPVHLYGQCARMDEICDIAKHYGLHVIEDGAQSIGAEYQGRPACSWGDVGCLSFYPTKNLGACGDAGMLVTSDEQFASRLRLLAAHGMNPRYYHKSVGINSRLDTLQAALLLVKLRRLESWNQSRDENARRYLDMFRAARAEKEITLPVIAPQGKHVWNQFTIRVPGGERDALRKHLADRGVGTEIYYPLPLHRQECFRDLCYAQGSLPETERAANEVLSLPIFPELTRDEQQWVVDGIVDFYAGRQTRNRKEHAIAAA